jgi:prepilin peptidase CpaA
MTTLALFFFPLLMAYAASSDLLTMRISNKIVLALIVGFLVMALVAGLSFPDVAKNLACAVAVLLAAFAFFAFGWIGGGDAKLAAATTLWLGFGVILNYVVYAALIGGVLTVLILMLRRIPLNPVLTRFQWLERLHNKKSGVPYGIALAAAGMLTYSNSAIFTQLAG